MQAYELSVVAGLALGGFLMFYVAFVVAQKRRQWAARRVQAAAARVMAAGGAPAAGQGQGPGRAPEPAGPAGPDPMARRLELRLEAVEVSQGELADRIEALAEEGGGARMQALAGSLAGIIRDKSATLETALAGLDQLRGRLKTLEQIGDLAEARRLFEGMGGRLDALEAAQARAEAAAEARIAALEAPAENPFREISDQLTRLYAQKDAAVEAVFARLAPLEAKLAEAEQRFADPSEALDRFAERLEQARGGLQAQIDDLRGESPFREISDQLTRLYAQKDAMVETVFARLAPLETKLADMEQRFADPEVVLDRFAERLAATEARLQDRIDAVQAPDATPFREISEQLTRLYAQKDAAVEAVFARLAPLEAKLAEAEARYADPRALLDRFAERLEALQARVADLETPDTNPFAEISEQLTRLYAQKDAAVETVLARLAPLEAKLARVEQDLGAVDPTAALDRFAERLEHAREGLQVQIDALRSEDANPFREISDQLTRLYAQKDAAVETVFARLAPLEAKLAEVEQRLGAVDPQAALDRFAERLASAEARLHDRIDAVQAPDATPFREISEQLTRLYAQKDAAVETVFARLAPLEAKLAEVEQRLGAADPRAALDRFAERFETLQARVAELELPAENPFAEISDQLTRLYAQKDAAVETVFARLAPLEAKLAEVERRLGAADPKAALDRFAERFETLQARVAELEVPEENPFAEISEQLTRLYAQKDAAVETVFARLAPLEAKLADVEQRLGAADPKAALDRFAERFETLQARVAELEVPEENPFAEISEQLTKLYAQKDAAVETVFARLAPLEAKLAEVEQRLGAADPKAALDRFAERFETLQARVAELEVPVENPFAEISEQLTKLYAQKDAAVETVFARLAPLEAKLAEVEQRLGAADPKAALARFAERFETLQARLAELETPVENPFAEVSEQLTRLYAQKDAAAETVAARLAPLEAKLAEVEARFADPRAAFDGLAARLAALEAPGTAPFAEISEQLTRLYAQKDTALETVAARLAALEARLGDIETRGLGEDEARAEAQAIAAQMIAARTVAEETRLFADRLSLLEASLPRLSRAQSLMMQALERQAAPWPLTGTGTEFEPAPASVLDAAQPAAAPAKASPAAEPRRRPDDLDAIARMPRVVSLHKGER